MPKSLRHRLLAVFVLLLPAAPHTFAGELDDIDIPYEQFTLDNGLRVIVHTDRKAPIVAVNTWYHVGSKDEPDGKTGFAHLFEHLMFQGSENYDDEYFKPLGEIGATGVNGTTNFDRTNYFQTVPTGALERLLWLESDRMTHLLGAISQKKLDEQREVVKNEKRQRENQPFGKTWEQSMRGIFPPGHPYRRTVIGSMQDLDAATLEDVFGWFKQYYGASNVVIALSGDIDVDTARALMEKYYGDAPAGEPLERLSGWIPRLTENRHETVYDRAAAGFIRRFWPVPSTPAESAGLALWGSAFASGRTAPLHNALVEEHRLASSVHASPIEFEVAGIFYLSVQLLPGADVAAARRILDETMAEFLESGPAPDRLERLRTQSLTSSIRGLESAAGKASMLISGAVFGNNPNRFKESLAAVSAATPDDLAELADDWLTRPYYELTGLPFPRLSSSTEGADRSTLPDLAAAASFQFPDISERELDNGIRLVLARREGLPVTDITLRFPIGSASESEDARGLTQVAFDQLTSGTTSRDAVAISSEIERLGSFVRASSGYLASQVASGGLTEKLPEIVALLADLLTHPTYPEDQFALQADRWVASIQQERTRPNSVARTALRERVYGLSHPYGRQMTEQAVRRMNREQAADFHKAEVRGQPFTVFAAGDVTMNALAAAFVDAFGGWETQAQPQKPPSVTPAPLPEKARVFLIDMPQTQQSVILAGHTTPPTTTEPDVSNMLANQILGGAFVSRINLNLREDKGWSYGARTSLNSDRFQPLFSVSAPVQVDKTAESVAEIHRELAEYINSRPATDDEFRQAWERNVRSTAGRYETGRALLNSLISSADMQRSWRYPVKYDEALQLVTLDDVRAAGRRLVKRERLTWVIAGDLAKFESDVRALDIGEVVKIDVFGTKVDSGGPQAPSAAAPGSL